MRNASLSLAGLAIGCSVHLAMQPPRFGEAAFQVGEGTTRIAVGVSP